MELVNAQAYLSTQDQAPCARARLPPAHVNRRWPRGIEAAPLEGTPAPERSQQSACQARPLVGFSNTAVDYLLWRWQSQVKRSFRLTRSTDIMRVRRSGKSYAHPLVVLYVLQSDFPETRVGVSAGVAVGNAVKRNRAKRLLRAAMSELVSAIVPGFNMLLVARSPLADANVFQTREALSILLKRAGLLAKSYEF